MPKSRLPACSVQSTEQVTSPRASPPRRMQRSRQGNAGVIVNLGEGSTSFIVAQGQASITSYSVSFCKDKRCLTCKTFDLYKLIISKTTHRKYARQLTILVNHTCLCRLFCNFYTIYRSI